MHVSEKHIIMSDHRYMVNGEISDFEFYDTKGVPLSSYLGSKPEAFDTIAPLVDVTPPASATVGSTVFISAINGTAVTVDFGNNYCDITTGEFTSDTYYDSVVETSSSVVTQAPDATTTNVTIDVANGALAILSQTVASTITLVPKDTTKANVVRIWRKTTAGTPGMTWPATCIFEGAVQPSVSTDTTKEDDYTCLYIPQVAKWLVMGADGYGLTVATSANIASNGRRERGGAMLYKHPSASEESFETKTDNSPFALAVGQEGVIYPDGSLYFTDILYNKTRNAYTSVVYLDDTTKTPLYEVQTITQAAGTNITIDCNNGYIVYWSQDANVTINITNASPTDTTQLIIIRVNSTDTAYTIAWGVGITVVGETSDSPSYSNVAGAIDVIFLSSVDGGITWTSRIKNDFRA